MDEVGEDSLQTPGVTLLDELRIPAVERTPLAARKRTVKDVPHDTARESQPVAPGLPLFFEDPFPHEPLRRVVQALRLFHQDLEVFEVEALAEHGRDGEKLAQIVRQALDPLLDGLLDRGRQRVGIDAGGLGEIPGAGVVPGDPARVDQGPDELLREERVALGRVAQPLRQRVGDFRAAGHGFDQAPMLGRRERSERQRDETRVVGEGVQHPEERMALVDLVLTVAADDEGRGRPQPADDVLQRLDRDLCSVQVLQDEDEGLAAADARQRARQQLEDLDPVLGLALLGGRRELRAAA